MIITAKATQPQAQPRSADPAEAYVLKNAHEKSKTPYAFFLVLMGLGLYLKSIFPGWSRPAGAEDGAPGEADRAEPQVAELDPAQALPAGEDDLTTGTPGADQGAGAFSGGALVALAPSARFGLIDSPAVDFFLPGAEPDAFTLVEPYRQNLRAMNDNLPDFVGGAESAGGTGGTGGTGGANPDGPTDRDDADGPDDPDGPGNPDDPGDPVCAGPGTGGPCDDDEDDDEESVNRAPRVAGPVHLYDLTGCAILAIGLLDLLRGASDPDGDALGVAGLTASSGTLSATAFGWTFQPAPFAPGPVTLTYTVTDGSLSVAQTAHFTVLSRGWFEGTDGDDVLTGSTCGDDIEGGDGDDVIDGRAGNDTIHGGAGDDHILAGDGDDTIFAGSGNDIVLAGRGNDIVFGGAGDDRLFGEDGDDILHGDAGDDFLSGGAGNDMLFGGAGDDVLQGEDGDDHLDGGEGGDRLAGGAGNDRLFGAAGDDRLDGGAGDDVLSDGAGSDMVLGGAGDDTVVAAMDGADDHYDGGCDYDTVDYSLAELKLAIDMELGTASGAEIGCDTITGFETVIAGAGDDTITGSAGDDHIVAGAGDDRVAAGAGDDTIEDGAGADTVLAGSGDDMVIAAMDGADDLYEGGEGCDVLDYSAATGDLVIDLAGGKASGIEIGCDTISGFETVVAGAGDDHFVLGTQAAALYGGAGENVFEFAGPGEAIAQPRVFEIFDFKAGDRIRMDKYDLFEKVFDDLEDQFETIYGNRVDEEDFAVRTRLEEVDGITRTIIEADFNRDDTFETAIIIDGRHVLVMVETA